MTEFPHLAADGCTITSPQSKFYNCIAWAAGRDDRNWWPVNYGYWPRGVRRALSLDAFVEAFESLGYERCSGGALEAGYEKVVLYALNDEPTHAARQLPDGRWSSKLGKNHDVMHHTVRGVEGPLYGRAVQYMRRPRTAHAPPPQAPASQSSTSVATEPILDGHDADDGPVPT